MTTRASARHRWKNAEAQLARIIGGVRIPVSGRARGSAPDIEHPRYSVEVKSHALPEWLLDAMDQAETASQATSRGDKVPVVLLHQPGSRYDSALAVLRIGDLP